MDGLRETRCGWARSKEADLRKDAEMERICEIQSFVVFSKSQHVLPQPIFKRSEAESEKERGFERDVVSFAVAKELSFTFVPPHSRQPFFFTALSCLFFFTYPWNHLRPHFPN